MAVVQPATLMRWHRQGFPKLCQSLPPDKQEVVLDFAEFLVCRQWPTSWAVAKRQEMVARTIIQRVGVIKVEEHISFADAFASALAERLHVPLMTTDHQEFDNVEQKGHFRFLW